MKLQKVRAAIVNSLLSSVSENDSIRYVLKILDALKIRSRLRNHTNWDVSLTKKYTIGGTIEIKSTRDAGLK